MSETNILFKLIGLYLLDKSNIPLSNSAICRFFVQGNYTDYFNAVSIIGDLEKNSLIDKQTSNNNTLFSINEKGRKTLYDMDDRIGKKIRNEVSKYLEDNKISFKESAEVYANYCKSTYGGYLINLRATFDNTPVINLEFHIGSESQAKSICTNWKNNYEKVYEILMDNLI